MTLKFTLKACEIKLKDSHARLLSDSYAMTSGGIFARGTWQVPDGPDFAKDAYMPVLDGEDKLVFIPFENIAAMAIDYEKVADNPQPPAQTTSTAG